MKIEDAKVGMRVRRVVAGMGSWPGIGDETEIIAIAGELMHLRRPNDYAPYSADPTLWEPAPSISRARPFSNGVVEDEDHFKMLAFFTVSNSPNTCPKCGAPKGCKYHE